MLLTPLSSEAFGRNLTDIDVYKRQYHYKNVTDVENYSVAIGTALAEMSIPIIIHSFLSLFYQVKVISVVGCLLYTSRCV